MGQEEVYNYLRKNKGKWFTSREIAEELKISVGSVQNSLRRLRGCKFIYYKKIIKDSTELFEYMYKK